MARTHDDRRRMFLWRMAQLGMTASAVGLWTPPVFGDEPQNCAGPKAPTQPIKWTPDTNPILPRLAASTLGDADVAKLRKAYAALRNLAQTDPNDPRGWLQQGDKHCWNCGGGLDGQTGEEIHGSWLFLPWHRAFLYFHERILGALINDNTLRLAYWDWDNTADRGVPPAWLTPNDPSQNSLFDAQRGAATGDQLPDSLVGQSIMDPIVNASNFATFGGDSANAGNLENGPHGAVHIWCGDTTLQSAQADMGLLDTAAQDPLFFTHHANIDRLWDAWLQSAATHTNPTNASWLRHRFTFWDEQKRWVSITTADVINMSTNLRYTYDGGAQTAPQITLAAPKMFELSGDPTKGLTVPDEVKRRATSPVASGERRLTTLRVEGVRLPAGATGIFRIVASGAAETAAAAAAAGGPSDLGYIAIVPRTSKGGSHVHGPVNVELDVTRQLPQLVEKPGTLHLSYVPIAKGGATKGNRLTYRNVYLIER